MMKTIASFCVPLADKIVRDVAIVTDRDMLMVAL